MKLNILFENERVIVVDKPHGCLTTPARLANDPRSVLGLELQAQVGCQIYPVHRLDYEVSGITLWAKDRDSHRETQAWFESQVVRKVYCALTLPWIRVPPLEQLTWNSKLVRGKRRSFVADHGKVSLTLARFMREHALCAKKVWEWELEPVTGRPHQLRVELARNGVPIIGDVLYGGPAVSFASVPDCMPNYMALRATQLDLGRISVGERLGLPEKIIASPLVWPTESTITT